MSKKNNFINRIISRINESYQKYTASEPGFRPQGWEYPPKELGDSDQIITRGEKGGTPTILRFRKEG